MTLESYGLFARLPREIRDQIYSEYFTVDSTDDLEHCLQNDKAAVSFYVAGPNISLMKVSRALYNETFSFWERTFKRRQIFRLAIDVPNLPALETVIALTVAVDRLARAPAMIRHDTRAWINAQPRPSSRSSKTWTRLARLVIPDLKYFFAYNNNHLRPTIEAFRQVLVTRHAWNHTRLNILVENPTWPLVQPGENVWYERLHNGWTRRSLLEAQKRQLNVLADLLSDIINKWWPLVQDVSFTFGTPANRRDAVTRTTCEALISAVREKVGITVSYTR